MGAGSSKINKKIAEVEASYIERERKLIEQRQKDLHGKEEELQSSKKVEDELLKTKVALAQQIKELSEEFELIEREREKQVTKLKSDLQKKVLEAAETRRSSSGIVIERDNAYTRIAVLEKEVQKHREEADGAKQRQDKAEEDLVKEKQALKKVNEALVKLDTEKQQLVVQIESASTSAGQEVSNRAAVEQELEDVKRELEAAKKDLSGMRREKVDTEMQLRTTKAGLETSKESLAALRKQQENAAAAAEAGTASATQYIQGELNVARQQLDASRENAASLARELASATAALEHSEAKRNTLQRGQNESITKSSAQHEMIQALKMELTDTLRHYKALQAELQTLRASSRADENLGVTSVSIPVSAKTS